MDLKSLALGAAFSALPVLASAHMIIEDSYARASNPNGPTGAAFMTIENHSDIDDRVVSATSSASQRVELHTHLEDDNGVMRMIHVEEGFPIAAGETIVLERGGKHVMFMGLVETFDQGAEVEVTFTFEHADPVTITIPVDNERQPSHGGHGGHNHGGHDHSNDS